MTTSQSTLGEAPLPAGDWRVVPERSSLGFLTRIMFGLIPVRGSYAGFDGEHHIDDTGNASGVLRIDAETISTGINRRDTHLRSQDFFAVDQNPRLTFDLTSLTRTAASAGVLTGTLRIRDTAVPINTPASIASTGADGLRIDADFEVDPRAPGFEFKWLPRTTRVQATLTLQPISWTPAEPGAKNKAAGSPAASTPTSDGQTRADAWAPAPGPADTTPETASRYLVESDHSEAPARLPGREQCKRCQQRKQMTGGAKCSISSRRRQAGRSSGTSQCRWTDSWPGQTTTWRG